MVDPQRPQSGRAAAAWRRTGWGRAVVLVLLAGAPCDGSSYLNDQGFRRAALLAALPNRNNEYAALRLARYATADELDWERRPQWNPPTEPLAPGASGQEINQPEPLLITQAAMAGEREALRALGEAAFFSYPAQLAPYADARLATPAALLRYGLWNDGRRAGGLVRVVLADGSTELALSCATCHARQDGATLRIGVGNQRLNLGALIDESMPGAETALPQVASLWGPGRVDVSSATGDEPASIPDLRPVRWLTHLQHAAAVQQHDISSLAVRIETLLITAHGGTVRPPREVALGLAVYVSSLAEQLVQRSPQTPAEVRGAALFSQHCQSCHVPPGYAGEPIPLATIGTDPTLGQSPTRGTGSYRVPSLRGVAQRGAFLHDGTLSELAELFDPARLQPSYQSRHGRGPVGGHAYGLTLDGDARHALVAFLNTL